MEETKLICINCPMGCSLVAKIDEEKLVSVSGNNCKYGEIYARKEISNPVRMITSTIEVADGTRKLVSVKTKEGVPKGKIWECMEELRNVKVSAPVYIGDVIIRNIANTGVDIIATKDVEHCVM